MRYAIFSDIHNNTSALQIMLTHAHTQQIDRYYCLGDVGIDECVTPVRDIGASTVFGNWEVSGWRYLSPDNQAWVLNLPPMRQTDSFWLTHAAPFWPDEIKTLADYQAKRHTISASRLFPYLHFESDSLWNTFATLNQAQIPLLFHGHTHRQIAWRFTEDNHLQRLTHPTVALRASDTLVVGVGSVGRPEDGPGAAYVIYDDELGQVEFIRVQV